MEFNITHDQSNHVFTVEIDGKTCELNYKPIDKNRLEYYHVGVPAELQNQGIASKIVKYALEYARDKNFKIRATCPFVRSYIDLHPQYKDLSST